MNAAPAQALLGAEVHLFPGRGEGTIQGHRTLLAGLVAKGRRAHEVPALLASIFTLCAMGQRWVAQRAIAAARGVIEPASRADLESLRAATAREQVLRMLHDWPRELALPKPLGEQALALLHACPLWQPSPHGEPQTATLGDWLAQHWLRRPVHPLLDALDDAPPSAGAIVADWAESTDTAAAQVLRAARPMAERLATRGTAARLLDGGSGALQELAGRMAGEPQFCARPDWRGEVLDTGPWTRLHDASRASADNAWMRLASRLVDVLRLADMRPDASGLPAGTRWLAHGALALPGHEGVAWAETARGLLVHWVRLNGRGVDARVLDMHVLAPTEWNFHPDGVLADALARLGAQAGDEARCLAMAFDPCVPFVVHAAAARAGDCHA